MADPQTQPDLTQVSVRQSVPAEDPLEKLQRTNRLLLLAIAVLAIALAVSTTLLFVNKSDPSVAAPSASNSGQATAPPANPGAPAQNPVEVTEQQIAPPHATTDQKAINLALGSPKADALTLDIHLDYQCPYCAQAETTLGDALYTLAQSGDLVVNYHIRSFLDSMIGNDSSTRAGVAASCADTVNAFGAYNAIVFANQPQEGLGYTEEMLRETFAAQAGITGDNLSTFQQCYDTRATQTFVTNMESLAMQDQINGTPTFIVNGIPIENWTTLGSTPDALLTSLKSLIGAA